MRTSTDFQTLGRLGTASGPLTGGTLRRRVGRRGARVVRRRQRFGGGVVSLRTAAVGGFAILLTLFVLGTAAQSQLDVPVPTASSMPSMDPLLEAELLSGGTQMAATGARTIIPGGGATVGMVEVPEAFAAVEDLALHLPSRDHAGVVFTEADAADMLPLAPVGRLVDNANPAAFEPVQEFDGPEYVVGEAITGVRPATGLARVLLPPGTDLLAPVSGTVEVVEEYSTPEGSRLWRIVIRPATRSDLHVEVRRLGATAITVGQEVGVGQTVLGQVRATTGTPTGHNPDGLPSVWISARPAISDEVVDPNRPAVTPTIAGD